MAGVLYLSGLDPGGGRRWRLAIGRPEDISGFTTTASPGLTFEHKELNKEQKLTKFLPETLRAEMIEC